MEYRINEEIVAENVMLIDETGYKVGNVPLQKALAKAKSVGLDLVCVSTKPIVVCKIYDYQKQQYIMKKKEKENQAKQPKNETKEIQCHPNIAQHDLDTKLKKCREELEKGKKIRFVVKFRGREITHPELGTEILKRVTKHLGDIGEVSYTGSLEDRKIEYIINPKKK